MSKKRLTFILVLAFVMVITFSGCDTKQPINTEEKNDTIVDEMELSSERATMDANRFVDLLKQKNSNELLSILHESYSYEKKEIDDTIKCFENYYDLETLEIVGDGQESDNPPYKQYHFQIVGNKNLEVLKTDLIVRYNAEDNNKLEYEHIFIRYYPYAEKTLDYYLKYLLKGDVGQLSSFLSIDGGPDYYREEAEALIIEYNENYDMNSVTYEYIGFKDNTFLFEMRDGNGKTRIIPVVYGDGLVSVYEDIFLN